MADCLNNILTQDILKNCDEKPKAGLETTLLPILRDDIDWGATIFDNLNPLLLTNLVLKPGKSGHKIEGFKLSNTLNFEKQENDYGSGYQHKVTGVLVNPTASNRNEMYNLLNEERYVFLVERKWKGADDNDAFLMIGKDNGVIGKVHTYGSADNGGTEVFEMTTPDEELERYPAINVLHTDYETTKGAFDNGFAS